MQISFAALSCSNLAALSCSNLAAPSCSNLAALSLRKNRQFSELSGEICQFAGQYVQQKNIFNNPEIFLPDSMSNKKIIQKYCPDSVFG